MPNVQDKIPITTVERILTTEPPSCSLDCGPTGNCCYVEQFHENDEDEEAANSIENTGRRRQNSFKHRCQCPLGKSGTHCQNGMYTYYYHIYL